MMGDTPSSIGSGLHIMNMLAAFFDISTATSRYNLRRQWKVLHPVSFRGCASVYEEATRVLGSRDN